jgi:hypothetical protein
MKLKKGNKPAKTITLGRNVDPDGNWWVIFKGTDGRDLCVEVYGGTAWSFSEIVDMAYEECVHYELPGARIERRLSDH